MPRRESETFNSDLHLPRWRRVVLRVLESGLGRSVITLAAMAAIFWPIVWIGWIWIGAILLAGISFIIGWNAAWRRLKRDGVLNRL